MLTERAGGSSVKQELNKGNWEKKKRGKEKEKKREEKKRSQEPNRRDGAAANHPPTRPAQEEA